MNVRTMVHCPSCGATWDLDLDPLLCCCSYADPEVPVIPWTWSLEEVA